jgi:predicted N-formylglutamate amidohydrolase
MSLLQADEPPAFERVNENGSSPFVLLCDHASRRMPRALGTLGLSADDLASHIAWDIGAAEVARALSQELDAPLVLSGYSRLAIDCNRPLAVPGSIPEVTCEIPVPGNAGIDDEARRFRQDSLFWPYHRALEALFTARDAAQRESVVISLHSFTPASLFGKPRPWHIGVTYGRDRRFAGALFERLANEPSVLVGDNEPYRVTAGSDYGIPHYAERASRLGVLIEMRQDEVGTPSGVEKMVSLLARTLPSALSSLAREGRVVEAPPITGGDES